MLVALGLYEEFIDPMGLAERAPALAMPPPMQDTLPPAPTVPVMDIDGKVDMDVN